MSGGFDGRTPWFRPASQGSAMGLARRWRPTPPPRSGQVLSSRKVLAVMAPLAGIAPLLLEGRNYRTPEEPLPEQEEPTRNQQARAHASGHIDAAEKRVAETPALFHQK